MDNNFAKFLSEQLYPDLKTFIPFLAKKLSSPVKKANAMRFKTPESLISAIKSGAIKNGTYISLECKPSQFGSYLRNLFLYPIIGRESTMRLGPPLTHPDPIINMISNTTSYWKPVGLYPPINSEISQISLYPSDAQVCGVMGMVTGVNEIITSIPAIANQNKLGLCGVPSVALGIVRMVTQSMFLEKGFPLELYEENRASGNIWYLDLYTEGTEIKSLFDGTITEMWAGLYASGHLEYEGDLDGMQIIESISACFESNGFPPEHTINQAGRHEILIYSHGLRVVLDPETSSFSIHMDAEINIEYKNSRLRFDKICKEILELMLEVAKNKGIEIMNPMDLDFSYTDSAKSFKILSSIAAEMISDPVAIAIRDWHRLKNKNK
ncbi:hypothetical protein [Serratia liquefaciens]|uniref:hypothetical protein n=1 Tax=Serratia liquefaciens TaxID=614 RepID=UPI00301D378F